jgi:hypothetical protein
MRTQRNRKNPLYIKLRLPRFSLHTSVGNCYGRALRSQLVGTRTTDAAATNAQRFLSLVAC